MRIAGLVLAGGRSRRFGRDKAQADFGGRRLIEWSLGALEGSAVVGLNGPAALAQALALPVIADLAGVASGPLAGILAGIDWASSLGCTHLLSVPCDTPFLPGELLTRLAAEIGLQTVVAARAERVHPLCALWRCDLGGRLEALARLEPQPSLQSLVDRIGGGFVDFDDERAFANLNTPQDLEAAAARLAVVTQNKP